MTDQLRYDALFIGGRWIAPHSTERIAIASPSTGLPVGSVPAGDSVDIDTAVAAARRAFGEPGGWSSWPAADRADAMERLADALDARGLEFARRVSIQNGMPITTSEKFEATAGGIMLRYYATLARDLQFERVRPSAAGSESLVRRSPIGVVAAIIPWNFPQSLTFMKLGPILATGCTVVLKPAPETVLDAQLLGEAIAEAGIPAGVINIVPADREASAHLVQHPDVDKVAFTGSTATGRWIAEACGRMLRPVTLELGGKSAAIVLDDARLDDRLDAIFATTLLNNGQTCHLSTRILAPRTRYDEIVGILGDYVESLPIGDALDPATRIGPLTSSRQRDKVEGLIATGVAEGARIAYGGKRPKGADTGWFIEPTILADVDNRSTIAREEVFGPVLTVIPYDDVDHAVQLANDSPYGLGGSVWTEDDARGLAVARRIRTGAVGLNGFAMDFYSPFGGVKASGLGREMGPEGLDAYLQYQSIYL